MTAPFSAQSALRGLPIAGLRRRRVAAIARGIARAATSAVVCMVLAQTIGTVVAGAGPLPAKQSTLLFAAAIVVAAVVTDRGTSATGVAALFEATARGAALALAAVSLIVANGRGYVAFGEATRTGLAVAVLTMTINGATRLFGVMAGDMRLGTLFTTMTLALTSASPLWLGPVVAQSGSTQLQVDSAIALSPVTYLATMSGYDYLRNDWLYAVSPLGSVRFDYPGPWTSTIAYLLLAASLFAAHWALSRARRRRVSSADSLAIGWTCLLVVGLASAANAGEVEPLRIDVRPAWNGAVRAGTWTELVVTVVAHVGGEVGVEAVGGAERTMMSGPVVAGVEAAFRVPVRMGTGDSVAVTVRGPGAVERSLLVALHPFERGRTIVAAPHDVGAASDDGLLTVDASAVPATPEAFALLDAMIVTPALVSDLDVAQLRALESYLGDCGRVITVGLSDAAASRARERAGCNAAFLRTLDDAARVHGSLGDLLERSPAPPPGMAELAAPLDRAPRTAAASLRLFFALYAAVVLLGGIAARSPWLLAAVPAVASVVMITAFCLSRPTMAMQSWTATRTGAATARFAAVVRLEGVAPGRLDVPIDPVLGLPESERPESTTLHMASDGAGLRAEVDGALLSHQLLYFRGSVDWTAPLALDDAAEGLRIVNRGASPTAPAYLWSGEQLVEVPALRAGGNWSPAGTTSIADDGVPSWVARGLTDRAVLMVPESAAPIRGGSSLSSQSGWTVIESRVE